MLARFVLSSWLMLGLPLTAAAAGDELSKIKTCTRANLPQSLQIKSFELRAKDRGGGERLMQGKIYGQSDKGLFRATMKIEAPADMRGAAYLVREAADAGDEERYVFIPSLGKVRRISGGMTDSALFGTDLSYADIKQIMYAFSGGKLVLEKTENLEARPAWVLVADQEPAQASRFDQVRAWIDQKTCTVLKAEFLQDTIVRKRFTGSPKHLMQSGTHWYLSEAMMTDLQEKTSTQVKVTGVTSGGKALPDRLFNPRLFYLNN